MGTDLVFLTGATGFVGKHILTALLENGYRVRALARPHKPGEHVENGIVTASQNCDVVTGDLRHTGDLVDALRGCRYVVHCAALYSFSPRDRALIHDVNVTGTAGLLAAAHLAGVERAVVTSSSAAVGHEHNGRPATEENWALDDNRGSYHRSKLDQERAAFASRVPVITVLPTAPVGPGDWKPTPTGKMVLDFARGKMIAKPPGNGGMNLVAVEDVARAHVAAIERGRTGERYIVGGENVSFDLIWQMLAEITGQRIPRWRTPYALAYAAALVDEARCRLQPDAQPFVPLEGVRMSRERMYVDTSKAMRELGHKPRAVRAALERAVTWYRANGYLN